MIAVCCVCAGLDNAAGKVQGAGKDLRGDADDAVDNVRSSVKSAAGGACPNRSFDPRQNRGPTSGCCQSKRSALSLPIRALVHSRIPLPVAICGRKVNRQQPCVVSKG